MRFQLPVKVLVLALGVGITTAQPVRSADWSFQNTQNYLMTLVEEAIPGDWRVECIRVSATHASQALFDYLCDKKTD